MPLSYIYFILLLNGTHFCIFLTSTYGVFVNICLLLLFNLFLLLFMSFIALFVLFIGFIILFQLGLSTGRSESGLCPTRNRPAGIG